MYIYNFFRDNIRHFYFPFPLLLVFTQKILSVEAVLFIYDVAHD